MTTAQTIEAPAVLGSQLSASGIVRSEWIKLRTVRSSLWCYGLLIASVVGIGVLVASLANVRVEAVHDGAAVAITGDLARDIVASTSTDGLHLAVLIVAVLGSLIITGEYSTGMIRATFGAVPRRTGALAGKAVVLAVTTFVAALIGIWTSALITWPILAAKNVAVELGEPSVFLPLIGGALYLTMIALLAFALGTILRSTAGALATVLGLILVAPVILEILRALTEATWVANVSAVLPQNAGSHLFTYGDGGGGFGPSAPGAWTLNGWQGFAVLLAWDVVLLAIALIQVKRRDA